jgi:hypothetical protein
MKVSVANVTPAVGFLTVIEHAQHGLFGGYLILNLAGRPLEFHCTAPIKPSRPQEILYGPTLEAFLYGEQIGSTLLGHAKIMPQAVCTDREPVLSVRDLVTTPIALIIPPDGGGREDASGMAEGSAVTGGEPPEHGAGQLLRLDKAHGLGPRLLMFELGRNRLAVPQSFSEDRRVISEHLAEAAQSLDLLEPFGRIREAIAEAQQAVR